MTFESLIISKSRCSSLLYVRPQNSRGRCIVNLPSFTFELLHGCGVLLIRVCCEDGFDDAGGDAAAVQLLSALDHLLHVVLGVKEYVDILLQYFKGTSYAFLLQSGLRLLHEEQFHDDRLLLRVNHATVHLETVHGVGRSERIEMIMNNL